MWCVQLFKDFTENKAMAICTVCPERSSVNLSPDAARNWADEHESGHEELGNYGYDWSRFRNSNQVDVYGVLECPVCGCTVVPTMSAALRHHDWHQQLSEAPREH